MGLMQKIDGCRTDLKKLSLPELQTLADEIREFLIANVSKSGGHIGANLATIELTISAHFVFDINRDKFVWDTGHQGYTHKILTGRANLFPSLNKWGGMSRFLTRAESPHDHIDATHAGTSLATAAGMAVAMRDEDGPEKVVAIIGDGSLVEGIAFEGLNYLAGTDLPAVILLNDNEMAIAPNIGGIRNLTVGPDWQTRSGEFFRSLGFEYIAVEDGHDVGALVSAMEEAQAARGPIVVHIKTEKGRGLPYAKDHPYKMHFSMPFNPATGEGASPTVAGRTYATVAAEELLGILRRDPDVYVITPATPYASALDDCLREFPDRVIDVGMAEQHAVSMACGLALEGKRPIVCFQATFMQRAYDQILHDACYMDLPVTLLVVRSGFAGPDGPTHHGLYDIPYLRSFPNMQVKYPVDSTQLRQSIVESVEREEGPLAILHGYDPVPLPEPTTGEESDDVHLVAHGNDGLILAMGSRLVAAHSLREALSQRGVDFGLAFVGQIKPFPEAAVAEFCRNIGRVVTLEEGTLRGGFGSIVTEVLADRSIPASVLRSGIPDRFVPAGSKSNCGREAGIEPDQVAARVLERWPQLRNMIEERD